MNYLLYIAQFFSINAFAAYCPTVYEGSYYDEPTAQEYIYFWDQVFKNTPNEVEELWFKVYGKTYLEWRFEIAIENRIE